MNYSNDLPSEKPNNQAITLVISRPNSSDHLG